MMAGYRRMPDDELRIRALEILGQALGPVAAARFAAMLQRQPTDYVAVSRQQYADETVDSIMDRALQTEPPADAARP